VAVANDGNFPLQEALASLYEIMLWRMDCELLVILAVLHRAAFVPSRLAVDGSLFRTARTGRMEMKKGAGEEAKERGKAESTSYEARYEV
jgi:hypothetical protein